MLLGSLLLNKNSWKEVPELGSDRCLAGYHEMKNLYLRHRGKAGVIDIDGWHTY